MTGAANAVLAAAAAVALGGGLVTAGVASMPPRDDAAAVRIGGSLYAAECAGCHGAGLEGGAGPPALGAGGHAWRHADAELAAIIGGGVERAGAQAMPGFAGRLGGGEIGAVIAFLKAGWPPSLRAAQASLAGGRAAFPAIGPRLDLSRAMPPADRPKRGGAGRARCEPDVQAALNPCRIERRESSVPCCEAGQAALPGTGRMIWKSRATTGRHWA